MQGVLSNFTLKCKHIENIDFICNHEKFTFKYVLKMNALLNALRLKWWLLGV